MKQLNVSGEKLEKPSTDSDVKLFEMAFDASAEQREIRITFRGDSENSSTTSRIFLPAVKGAMIISTPTPNLDTKTAISSSENRPEYRATGAPEWPLSRHNWGEEIELDIAKFSTTVAAMNIYRPIVHGPHSMKWPNLERNILVAGAALLLFAGIAFGIYEYNEIESARARQQRASEIQAVADNHAVEINAGDHKVQRIPDWVFEVRKQRP